jgi:hypothetical protein
MMMFDVTNTTDSDETARLKALLNPVAMAKQIATDTAEIFTSIPDTLVTIDQQFNSIMQNMGVGRGYSEAIKDNLSKGAYAVLKLGGDIKAATALQNEVVDAFGKNIVLSEDMYAKLYASAKVSGVASKELLEGFEKAGMSMSHITEEMYKTTKIARDLGVSSQAVSKLVVGNLEQLNRFNFVNGVDGLAKMAAKATTLRIDMQQTLDFAEKMLNPEDAINMSAALQRLGNVSSDLIDPLKLMDLAQNNVPELQNQLSGLFKQYTFFNEETQAFEFFPDSKLKLRELQKELGIPMAEIEKMALGTANLDKKLADIDFSGLNITEDTQTAIANLATLDKNTGEYVITTKDGNLQNVNDLLKSYQGREEDLKNFITGMEEEAGKTYEEKMFDIAKEQLGLTGEMNANLNAMTKSLGLQISSTKQGSKALETAVGTVNVYSEAQNALYRPEVKGGYKGTKNQYDAGTFSNIDKYFDKQGNLDTIALTTDALTQLGTAATDLAKTYKNAGMGMAKITAAITGVDFADLLNKAFDVKDAVYFPEQNQVINKDKNDLVVFAQKENINVGEKPETTQNIEIPDISDSLISALQNIKIENNIPPIDLTKLMDFAKSNISNETINNFTNKISNQNLNNEVVQLTQIASKDLGINLQDLTKSLSSIIQKPIETPKPKETVNEVVNQPKEPQNTVPKETKIDHNITITFKSEGNNESLRMVANKFQNDDVFKSKIIQSLDIKKSNYQVDSDNPYQNYIQQISIA